MLAEEELLNQKVEVWLLELNWATPPRVPLSFKKSLIKELLSTSACLHKFIIYKYANDQTLKNPHRALPKAFQPSFTHKSFWRAVDCENMSILKELFKFLSPFSSQTLHVDKNTEMSTVSSSTDHMPAHICMCIHNPQIQLMAGYKWCLPGLGIWVSST